MKNYKLLSAYIAVGMCAFALSSFAQSEDELTHESVHETGESVTHSTTTTTSTANTPSEDFTRSVLPPTDLIDAGYSLEVKNDIVQVKGPAIAKSCADRILSMDPSIKDPAEDAKDLSLDSDLSALERRIGFRFVFNADEKIKSLPDCLRLAAKASPKEEKILLSSLSHLRYTIKDKDKETVVAFMDDEGNLDLPSNWKDAAGNTAHKKLVASLSDSAICHSCALESAAKNDSTISAILGTSQILPIIEQAKADSEKAKSLKDLEKIRDQLLKAMKDLASIKKIPAGEREDLIAKLYDSTIEYAIDPAERIYFEQSMAGADDSFDDERSTRSSSGSRFAYQPSSSKSRTKSRFASIDAASVVDYYVKSFEKLGKVSLLDEDRKDQAKEMVASLKPRYGIARLNELTRLDPKHRDIKEGLTVHAGVLKDLQRDAHMVCYGPSQYDLSRCSEAQKKLNDEQALFSNLADRYQKSSAQDGVLANYGSQNGGTPIMLQRQGVDPFTPNANVFGNLCWTNCTPGMQYSGFNGAQLYQQQPSTQQFNANQAGFQPGNNGFNIPQTNSQSGNTGGIVTATPIPGISGNQAFGYQQYPGQQGFNGQYNNQYQQWPQQNQNGWSNSGNNGSGNGGYIPFDIRS